MKNKGKIKYYKRGEIIAFGKFKGQTIDSVMQFEPDYVQWMVDNGIYDKSIITRMDRGEFKHIKLKDGYAIVF